jgi:hypothetical protein
MPKSQWSDFGLSTTRILAGFSYNLRSEKSLLKIVMHSVVKGKVEILSGAFPDKILPDLDNAEAG